MPSSTWVQTSRVCELLWQLKPKTVLDVGCGFGRWGFLARETLDIFRGRYDKDTWKTKINAVEIFEKYITPVHRYLYNEIFIGDALALLRVQPIPYDLIILGDVVEHFEKEQGQELIGLARARAANVIIDIPLGDQYPQKGTLGNSHEAHLAVWEQEDFRDAEELDLYSEPIKGRLYGLAWYKQEAKA